MKIQIEHKKYEKVVVKHKNRSINSKFFVELCSIKSIKNKTK